MVGSFRYSLSPSTFLRDSFLLAPKIQLGWRFDSFLLHHRYRYFIGAPETAKLHCNQSIFWSECTVQFHYSFIQCPGIIFPLSSFFMHFAHCTKFRSLLAFRYEWRLLLPTMMLLVLPMLLLLFVSFLWPVLALHVLWFNKRAVQCTRLLHLSIIIESDHINFKTWRMMWSEQMPEHIAFHFYLTLHTIIIRKILLHTK